MNAPLLRPLGIGEILDVAIKITTRHWWTLVRVVLVVVVPVELLSGLVDVSAADGALTPGDGPPAVLLDEVKLRALGLVID